MKIYVANTKEGEDYMPPVVLKTLEEYKVLETLKEYKDELSKPSCMGSEYSGDMAPLLEFYIQRLSGQIS